MTQATAKVLRAELAALLGKTLDVAAPPLGANINPPCVVVEPGEPYVEMSTYCADVLRYEVLVIAPPGSQDAMYDSLDDLIDQVRWALAVPSPAGFRFAFQQAGAPQLIQLTNDSPALLSSVVAVQTERTRDSNGYSS